MPKVLNILPKKPRETGVGRAMRPFAHGMEDFLGDYFPRRWMEGFMEPYDWNRPLTSEFDENLEFFPKVDIIDKGESLVVRAEMPGIKKEDLEITIAGDRLTFEARRDFEEEEKKDDYFRHEMAYGRMFRVVPLPMEIIGDKAKAELKEGILEVYLPKVEVTKPLTVKVA